MTFQQFQLICDFYYLLNKAAHWQYEVLDRLSIKDALWNETPVKESNRSQMVYISLLWRRQNHALLSQVSPHNPEDWLELAKLSSLLPEGLRKKGMYLSSRCLLLWNILTSKSAQVHQSDLQQLISWKNTISKDPALEITSLDNSTYDFSVFPAKTVCDLKTLPHAGVLQAAPVEHLRNNEPSQSIHDLINPWLSIPLANFSNGAHQHVKTEFGAKQAINTFGQMYATKQISDNNEPYFKSIGVQAIVCKPVGTQKSCGIQTDSCKSLSTTDEKIEHYPKKEDLFHSLTKHFCKIGTHSRTVWNRCHCEHSNCNQLIDWEEEVLCNIEELLRRAEAILQEEEDVLNQEKSNNLENDQQHLPVYHISQNSTGVDQGYAFLEKKRCLDSAHPDTTKEYNEDLKMIKQRHLCNIIQELEEVYTIEECIMEENQKIREFHELMQRELIDEQQTFYKQVKEKVFFLKSLEREVHQVENLEKKLAREDTNKNKQKKQMDKI